MLLEGVRSMTYRVLCQESSGNLLWSEPFSVEQVRAFLNQGRVTLDVAVCDEQGTELSVRDLLQAAPTSGVPWGKIIAAGLALVVGALVVRKALQDPEPARIEELAEEHLARGATVCADIKGWPQPPVLNGSRPDVFVITSRGKELAIEVENDKSVDRSHARGQVTNLSLWAARSEKRTFRLEVVEGGRGGKSA